MTQLNMLADRITIDESRVNIEDAGVFCLRDDYTAQFQEKYPQAGITIAEIRTDMLNIRRLETTKESIR